MTDRIETIVEKNIRVSPKLRKEEAAFKAACIRLGAEEMEKELPTWEMVNQLRATIRSLIDVACNRVDVDEAEVIVYAALDLAEESNPLIGRS